MEIVGARHGGDEERRRGRPALSPVARRAALARLKAQIGALAPVPKAPAAEGRPPLALIEGGVLELRVADWRHRPAAAAFALALAGKGAAAGRAGAPGGAVVMLARGEDARDAGAVFARGLAAFGVDPARVLLAHARGGRELLWAAEEAARTKGLGAVLVESGDDARRLDLTASRRLVLAAEESGAAVVLIRMAPVSPPSAAAARFLIAPALSAGDPDDGKAPGAPRWRVAVERFRPDARQAARGAFLAEWRHERKDFDIVAAGAPVPVPLSAVLADGALPAAPSRLLRRGA